MVEKIQRGSSGGHGGYQSGSASSLAHIRIGPSNATPCRNSHTRDAAASLLARPQRRRVENPVCVTDNWRWLPCPVPVYPHWSLLLYFSSLRRSLAVIRNRRAGVEVAILIKVKMRSHFASLFAMPNAGHLYRLFTFAVKKSPSTLRGPVVLIVSLIAGQGMSRLGTSMIIPYAW